MEMNEGRKIRWYEVMYVIVLLGLLAWSVFFMNPHKVAVVDVDRVFKDVGALQKIEKERQKLDSFVKANQLLQAYKIRMKSLQDKMAEAKTATEKDKIVAQMKAGDEQFSQSIGPLQSALQQFDNLAVASFRKRLGQYINQVALKRGADVVLTTGPNLPYFSVKVDVTEDVVKASKDFFAKDMPVIDPAFEAARLKR
ncbi:MAG: OmpH family outer membrane protein [bacterium]|jgi:Skp family chaperone for outer membrane proteins